MATEEEAREGADGQEVQVEAVDLGTAHLQMHLDGKVSYNREIKNEAKIMDSTEGMLKVTEDQVLVKAPSVVETPPEHTPNGTASSLNGHMEERKITNEKLQESEQKDKERMEASPDGISTYQRNKSNGKEEIDSLGHGESSTKDTCLLKHENEEPKEHDQQYLEGDVMDEKMVHKDTLKTDNDVEPTVDAQQGQNLESVKPTENTQPASMSCIPDDEVVAEAPVGVQTSLDPNVDDSDALPDTSEGNTETVEQAKVDKESGPEDEDITEHTHETAKLEDQPSKQTDDVGTDVVQEDVPKSKMPEDMSKTEQADELTNGDQEVLNQESPEETSDPVCEKTEETSNESNVATSEETTLEHDARTRERALDIQEVQNQGSVEEMADAKEVDREKTMQQSSVAFEEANPEDNVATTEPSSDIQHLNNVESEEIKGLENAKAEETSNQSNVAYAEYAVQDMDVLPTEPTEDIQPVQGLKKEETKNTGTVEMDEASNQTHADVLINLAEEDGVAASEPQVTGLEEEVKDTEATETQEITHQSHTAASEELVTEDNSMAIEPRNDDVQQALEQCSVEVKDTEAAETQEIFHRRTISAPEEDTVEDVTAQGPTCDAQEVQNVESAEEIKDIAAENIVEASYVATVEEADQENNVLTSEDISEQQIRGLEPEEIKNTEPVETEEASDQRHAILFNDPAQEGTIPSKMLKTESTVEVKEIEGTKTEAIPQESNVSISEEPVSEENITASETACGTQVNNVELAEDIDGNKDTTTEEISDQSNGVLAGEAAQGTNDLASEPTADMQSVQELESLEQKNAELIEVSEASHQMDATILENSTQEHNLTTTELHVMESAEESSNEATEDQETPHQNNVAQSGDQETEENIAASGPQILEPEPDEEMKEIEATEPQGISQQSIVSTSEETVPEEDVTAKEPASDNKEVQNEEPELIKEHDDVKAEEISNQSSGTIVGDAAQENKLLASDPINDVQAKELELQEIRNTEDVGTEEASRQTNAEENLTANEPQMIESSGHMTGIEPTIPEPTEYNTRVAPDVGIQQHQEQESIEFRDTEATEPQGICPSHTVYTSEESKPEDNVTTKPSADTQAESLESATVTKDTEDVKGNVPVAEEENPEAVLAFEATVYIPPVQEPELEETKNSEPVEMQDNITASGLTEEEVKNTETMEIKAIHNESTVVDISELTEDVKSDAALADEAAPDEHVLVTEATVNIPPVQEPEPEEIEVENNITASNLPVEEESMETEAIPHESTVANISELTEDVKCNVALADEAAPEEHVLATDATVDIPPAQETELEEIKNTEPVEVENNIAEIDLPAEEMKDTEAMETEAIPHESTVASIKEYNEDDILTASAQLADIQLVPEQESVEDKKHTYTTEYQGEHQRSIASTFDDLTPTEEKTTVADPTCDTNLQNVTSQEMQDIEKAVKTEFFSDHSIFSTTEVAAQESVLLGSEPSSDVQQVKERHSTEETRGMEAVQTEDDQQHGVSTLEKPVPENNVTESEPNFDDQKVQEDKSALEVKDIEAMETEEISNQSNNTITENAAQETSELGSDPDFIVQSAQQLGLAEDSKGSQFVKAEEAGQSNGATLEEPTAEDSAANEMDPPADTKQEHALESVERNKDIDVTEAEEAFRPSQDAALEEPASESNIATSEPIYDIQEVNDLEEAEEMKETQVINDEDISCQKTEIAILKDLSPTDNGTAPIEHPVESNEENLVNEIDNVTWENEKIKDEIQEPTDQMDESSDLCAKSLFTTQKGEGTNEEDDVRIPGEDTIGIPNNIEQIKEESKTVTEHDSSQMSSGRSEESIAYVQNSVIKEEELPERGTAKASQASVENDPQAVQDVAEKDDTIKSGEHTNDQDNKQLHNVVLQMQVWERSVDALAIGQQDEAVQKVNLDQQQKEDEEIEQKTQEIETDKQKHDDNRADFTTEPLLEPPIIEIDTTNRKEDADVFEAEQTEIVATEMLKNEQTLHIPQESIPSITDMKVENSTEIKEGTEEENAPNNVGSSYADPDAENYNQDEQDNTQMDAVVAKTSSDEQNGTTDEIRNEEVGCSLASPVEKDLQKISDPAPSNEEMLENNPTVVPQNVEYGVHREEKECIDKVNDDLQAVQASDKEIVDEVEEKQQMQNEDNDVHHEEFQTKPEEEEASELHSNEPYSTDTKMDDTMSPYAEIVHGRTDAQPREIEEIEENKGFSSISEYAVETSKQNDVEQHLSIHYKVADEKLVRTEHNGVEAETDSNEEMETSYTAATEAVKFDEAIYNKASGADGALSDENLKTFEDTRRNLEASSVITASKGESMNEDKEHHKLALPAHSTLEGNTTEQASGLEKTEREFFPEKPLPAEPEEHEESQITKEQDEENIHEQEIGDTEKEEKEAEQSDLPVSHFLMNLIMGKESNDPDRNSESEAAKKQEETTKDDSCLITSQQEEILVPIPTENKVDNKLIFEQEKQNLEGSEETHDFKLETDEEPSRNNHDSEAPVCQDNAQDENSSELVPGEAPGLVTEMETRDFKLGEKAVDYSVCQEHMEATTQIEQGSLKSNLDDSIRPKASQEDTLEEGRTDLLHESLPGDRSSDAVAEQTLLSTEPDMGDEKKLTNDTDDLQSPLSTKQEDSTESSIAEAKSTIEAQLENEEVDDEEENQNTEGQIENMHDNSQKGTGSEVSDDQTPEITEPVRGTEINLVHEKEISAGSACMDEKQSFKFSNNELGNSEKALEMQSDGPNLHINQDKQDESADNQIVMEKNNLVDKPGESNLQEEQETDIVQKSPEESGEGDQHFLAISESVIKEENVNRTVESHVQTVNIKSNEEQENFNSQVQECDIDVVSTKEAPEAEERFVEMTKPEFSTDEEQSPKKDESNMAEEKIYHEKTKDEEEAKIFTDEATIKNEERGAVQKASHNQKHDLDVVSPKEAPEENFVDITKPEFSTDEEQSPNKDESNMAEEKSYDEKTKGDEEAKNFTDEAAMKIEEQGAGQKASPKKHNILSGVGSKVKHQLAKVKKAIVGKPGHTKSESAKS